MHQPSFPAVRYQWAQHTSHSLRVHFCQSQVSPDLQSAVLPGACRICTGENKISKKESWPYKQPLHQPLPGKSGVQEPLLWQLLFMWQAVCFRQKLNILGNNGFGLMAVIVLRGQPKHQPQGNGRLKGLERVRQLVPRSVLVSLAWGRVQRANCAPESCGSAGVRECL